MLRIRLRRIGRKNDPHFQIVVTPRTKSTKGHYIAKLGWFDPISKKIGIDKVETKKWLDEGAQPTNTVARLLINEKISHKLVNFIPSAPKKSKKKEQTVSATKTPTEQNDSGIKDTTEENGGATEENPTDERDNNIKEENINQEEVK